MPLVFNPDAAKGVDAVVMFDFSGQEPGQWHLIIRDQTCTVHEGGVESPTVTLRAKSEDWLKLSRGELDPMTAFMFGKIKFRGDMGLLMRFQQMFSGRPEEAAAPEPPAVEETAEAEAPAATESVLDLNGAWQYWPDREGTGDPMQLTAGKAAWAEMQIPTNWELAGLHDYNGIVWFRRTFDVPEDWLERQLWLQFQGVDYLADVWLNAAYVGHHEGYFQPFEFNVSRRLKPGENVLLVKVDCPYEEPGQVWPSNKVLIKGVLNHHDCRPGANDPEHGQDKATGGIWNDVRLVATDDVRILRAQASPRLVRGGATVNLDLWIENLGSEAVDGQVTATIAPANFQAEDQTFRLSQGVHLEPGVTRVTLTQTISNPYLWATWDYGHPYLYQFDATVRVGTDLVAQKADRFGIRELTIDENWFWYLNGERIFVRGTNVIPTQWLSEYDANMIARDMELLRGANINGVRVHAHVQRPGFYAACDEAGILVWADFALQWSYNATDAFIANASRQIREMVELLYNHPSIVVWCCHNEPTHNRRTLDPVLEATVKAADGTRVVVPASDFKQHTYPGWYGGHMEHYAALPAAPFINEYGAQALPNLETLQSMFGEEELWPTRPEHWKKWAFHDFQYDQTFNVARIDKGNSIEEFIANSQQYQFDLLKLATETYRQAKYEKVTSLFQFMFMDPWPAITWSVVDYYRRPKLGYEALRLAFQPVLIVFGTGRYKRQVLEIGSLFGLSALGSVAIVNDYHRAFKDAQLTVGLEMPDGNLMTLIQTSVDIPADSVIRPFDFFASLEGPPDGSFLADIKEGVQRLADLKPGDYRLVGRLHDAKGGLLSENFEKITFVEPVVPMPMPF
ncbi:MAG TPA: beta-galactosidase [Anaerolineae bacterium]|nr:beta-galactosidase [Anaerolineae bacterium]